MEMKEEEKAKALYNRFVDIPVKIVGTQNHIDHAKACTLICVDEILPIVDFDGANSIHEFWTKVKEEIEKI